MRKVVATLLVALFVVTLFTALSCAPKEEPAEEQQPAMEETVPAGEETAPATEEAPAAEEVPAETEGE
jgi:hypothetical protein